MNSTHLIPALGLGIAILAAGCDGSSDPPARTTTSAQSPARTTQVDLPAGRIAFRRYFDDAQTHGAVFTADPDGTGEKQITDPPAGHVDDHPDWSPDGKRIAFERCSENKPCSVFTVAADGGRPHKVTAHCEPNPICDLASPAWMPDGRLLVTLAQGRERPSPTTGETWIQHSSVELIDPDTGTQRTIVERSDWTGDAGTPAVSPDGRTIVYNRWNSWRSKPADRLAIYAVDRDGSNHRRLTPWKLGAGDHPGFSPDGTILFRSYANDETRESDYWTVRPNGRAQIGERLGCSQMHVSRMLRRAVDRRKLSIAA